ncbi:RNA/RNP complex-1-interacting phosphatase-like [Cheilinus undulatus]|uniref:RNA/RNP complex-1-interacting phosphatase-like n=1 Tax=Cheilinus undulatus TaxID=241271 RepID=UPI001BD1C753|nr:RNA/RNP complex-1-interacting phosphatase-like [Cheilinus undulatus]
MPPHDMKKKKNGVPDRWLEYHPIGHRIPGTRFIAFKVPLKANRQVSAVDSFSLWDLLDSVQSQGEDLGLIIDLTFTTKYYQLSDVPQSVTYMKIPTQGQRVPSNNTILSFKQAVTDFLEENSDNDRLIGVHCTHGLNRTGYLMCRYLIDVDSVDPAAAVELFNTCRGHCIERSNYLDDLQRGARRSNHGVEQPAEKAARGLAVERPPLESAEGHKGHAPTEATQPISEKQPSGQRRHRARHQRGRGRGGSPPQSGLLNPAHPPSAPPPPAPLH